MSPLPSTSPASTICALWSGAAGTAISVVRTTRVSLLIWPAGGKQSFVVTVGRRRKYLLRIDQLKAIDIDQSTSLDRYGITGSGRNESCSRGPASGQPIARTACLRVATAGRTISADPPFIRPAIGKGSSAVTCPVQDRDKAARFALPLASLEDLFHHDSILHDAIRRLA